ncbi:MAG: LON peptidase substrate-binding domain-containing protein, partial [Desulfobacterales bacterium]|nr:LON peptidase substrate-binding domain-containing protein [Desulfobacterales bacterium]
MINIPKFFKEDKESTSPGQILPLLPLRDIVVFPNMVAPLFVGRTKSVNALADAMSNDKSVFLVTQKKAGVDNPREKDISPLGTIGTVLQLLRLPDGTVKALVEGKMRAHIVRFISNEGFFQVEVKPALDIKVPAAEADALVRAIVESFEEYAKLNKNISKELVGSVSDTIEPSKLADTVAAHFSFKIEDKQRLLEALSLSERLSLLLRLTRTEIDIYKMDQRIRGNVKDQMEKTQKNYYLT